VIVVWKMLHTIHDSRNAEPNEDHKAVIRKKIEVDVFGMPTCLCEVDGGCDDVEVRKGGCLCQLCTGHDGTTLMS